MTISELKLPDKMLKAHIKTTSNYEYVQKNMKDIQKEYAGQFVAISAGKIVFNTKDYSDMLKYLSQNRNKEDLIAVRIRTGDEVLLL